ncbi:MAG: GNAT family N-acetyltransferase [Ewingella sp.]
MGSVQLKSAKEHRHIIENLFTYYVYDLSESGRWPCGNDGRYGYSLTLLDPYWSDEYHWPWLIYSDEELAGFCLLRRYPDNLDRFDIDQFFVLRKFKGRGVGKEAFLLAVTGLPGLWQTRVLLENISALNFWRSAISSLTHGQYEEKVMPDRNLPMHFIFYQVSDTDD